MMTGESRDRCSPAQGSYQPGMRRRSLRCWFMVSINEFLRLALDPTRLVLLGRASEGPLDVDAIVTTTGLARRAVLEAMGKLKAAGLIGHDGQLQKGLLTELATSLPQMPPPSPELIDEGWSAEEAEVLSRFFTERRLTSIPASKGKRLIVLERLAQEFEPGLRYTEPEVNFALQLFHADYAALRRYLVDEGFMTRADGVYWRTGGRS